MPAQKETAFKHLAMKQDKNSSVLTVDLLGLTKKLSTLLPKHNSTSLPAAFPDRTGIANTATHTQPETVIYHKSQRH